MKCLFCLSALCSPGTQTPFSGWIGELLFVVAGLDLSGWENVWGRHSSKCHCTVRASPCWCQVQFSYFKNDISFECGRAAWMDMAVNSEVRGILQSSPVCLPSMQENNTLPLLVEVFDIKGRIVCCLQRGELEKGFPKAALVTTAAWWQALGKNA